MHFLWKFLLMTVAGLKPIDQDYFHVSVCCKLLRGKLLAFIAVLLGSLGTPPTNQFV